jgi:hypothetical protein
MELTLLQRAEEAERATAADEFRIISEAALAIFGWQDGCYKRVLRLLEAGASLDAAMTLVPEGFDWIIGRTNDGLTIHAEVGGRGDEFMRFAATPALALCAAALHARATGASHDAKEQNNGK